VGGRGWVDAQGACITSWGGYVGRSVRKGNSTSRDVDSCFFHDLGF
jgi:hypothetical protein